MRRLMLLVLAVIGLGVLRVTAEDAAPPVDPSLPAYVPRQQVSGELVLWGDDAFEKQMSVWAPAFRAKQPNLKVRWFLKGTSTAIGALYTGTAQIGLYGREIRPLEITAWKRIFPYEPLGFSIATG
jgi:phosphate transport system substrate-binding protein